jgi:hypothetical protein
MQRRDFLKLTGGESLKWRARVYREVYKNMSIAISSGAPMVNFRRSWNSAVSRMGAAISASIISRSGRLGWDKNLLFSDPLFVDLDNLDFRGRLESPPLKLGFVNFEMGCWGVTTDFPKPWLDTGIAPDGRSEN